LRSEGSGRAVRSVAFFATPKSHEWLASLFQSHTICRVSSSPRPLRPFFAISAVKAFWEPGTEEDLNVSFLTPQLIQMNLLPVLSHGRNNIKRHGERPPSIFQAHDWLRPLPHRFQE
jgi:hypothetical protein